MQGIARSLEHVIDLNAVARYDSKLFKPFDPNPIEFLSRSPLPIHEIQRMAVGYGWPFQVHRSSIVKSSLACPRISMQRM